MIKESGDLDFAERNFVKINVLLFLSVFSLELQAMNLRSDKNSEIDWVWTAEKTLHKLIGFIAQNKENT